MKAVFVWTIRTKTKSRKNIWGKAAHGYFADRTALKNPRFVTSYYLRMKTFASKDAALNYYFLKSKNHCDLSKFWVYRKKIHLDKNGRWDFWKNSEC